MSHITSRSYGCEPLGRFLPVLSHCWGTNVCRYPPRRVECMFRMGSPLSCSVLVRPRPCQLSDWLTEPTVSALTKDFRGKLTLFLPLDPASSGQSFRSHSCE